MIEDDPYYYLQFYDKRLPSLLSIDVDGRYHKFAVAHVCSGYQFGRDT